MCLNSLCWSNRTFRRNNFILAEQDGPNICSLNIKLPLLIYLLECRRLWAHITCIYHTDKSYRILTKSHLHILIYDITVVFALELRSTVLYLITPPVIFQLMAPYFIQMFVQDFISFIKCNLSTYLVLNLHLYGRVLHSL